MPKKAQSISIVIPVYNEEGYLKACLEHIAAQTVMPDEVIVVNNNSTDNSVKIAKSFKFVKVIDERKQGLIAARNKGFNSAKGDIIARIDADTRIPPEWTKRVLEDFQNDPALQAVTGNGVNYVHSIARIYSHPRVSILFSNLYFRHLRGYLGIQVVWGANMALRKSIWKKVATKVHANDKIVHEDQDLSLHIAAEGGKIKLNPKLVVGFDGSALQNWAILREYIRRHRTTKQVHIKQGTFTSQKFKKVPWPERLFYLVLTAPFNLFFHLTGIAYNKQTLVYINKMNRKQ